MMKGQRQGLWVEIVYWQQTAMEWETNSNSNFLCTATSNNILKPYFFKKKYIFKGWFTHKRCSLPWHNSTWHKDKMADISTSWELLQQRELLSDMWHHIHHSNPSVLLQECWTVKAISSVSENTPPCHGMNQMETEHCIKVSKVFGLIVVFSRTPCSFTQGWASRLKSLLLLVAEMI